MKKEIKNIFNNQHDILLSVIIVNYNTEEFIDLCLASIAKEDIFSLENGLEVFVVDNNSIDNSIAMINCKYPWVKLMENNKNQGFAKANNQAIQKVRGQYILFLNPDTVLKKGAFSEMILYMDEHPEVGLAGSRLIFPDNTPQESVEFTYPGYKYAVEELKGLPGSIAWVMGASMIARSFIIKESGGFDERFFLYGEDTDLCLTIRKKGWEIAYIPKAVIVHFEGQSERKNSSLEVFEKKERATILFFLKHYSAKTALRIKKMHDIKALWRLIILSVSLFFHQSKIINQERHLRYKLSRRIYKEMFSKIKIAIVVPRYGLMGGAENFVYELTERLARFENIEIHVFANKWQRGSSSILFHKIRTISFPRFLGPLSFAIDAFLKTRGRYDLIHSHDRIFFMDIFTFHGIPHVTWIKKVRKKKWLKLSDMIIAWIEGKGLSNSGLKKVLPVSSIAADETQKIYNLSDDIIKIMHPGISFDFFKNHEKQEARKIIRNRFGFSDSDILLLFVGMNFEIKNLDLVMEALAQCTKKDKNSFKLLVVGKGNKAKYTKKAGELGILNQVAFAGATSFVQDFYLASDIFIMPSRYDTFGMVVLEAMLAGLPVIISDTVGAKDLIDRSNGFIISPEADPAIVSDIIFQLKDSSLRQKMGKEARLRSLSCSWDVMAEEIYSLYLNLYSTGDCIV